MALSAFCIGKEQEGLEELKRLSSMGHIQVTYLLDVYYASGRTFNSDYWLTPGREGYQKNFDTAIYYFEKAADQIMSTVNYPYEVSPYQPDWEGYYITSAKVFVSLPNFYYEGYMRAIESALADSKSGKQMSGSDTITVLVKMRDWSEQCLKRPAFDVWKIHPGTANAMKAHCQATNNFAVQVLPLEQQRIKIVEDQCKDALLHKCPEHHAVVNQIMKVSDTMWKILEFVPLL